MHSPVKHHCFSQWGPTQVANNDNGIEAPISSLTLWDRFLRTVINHPVATLTLPPSSRYLTLLTKVSTTSHIEDTITLIRVVSDPQRRVLTFTRAT